MKVIKKICVYLLVGLITFSSVTLSYEKANSCKAVSLALEIGAVVLGVGLLCYSAYYISQPENQEDLKQSLGDYANMTAEGAQMQYELNKKLFNDFCEYATSNAGSNAAVRGADGSTYTIKQMQQEGFPDFEKWDEEMKKQSKKPSGGFGSIWDKMSFGLDLLEFICSFFDDDSGGGSGGFDDRPQYYFEGDDGYINRETGEVYAFLYSDRHWHSLTDDYYPIDTYRLYFNTNYGAGTKKRIAVFCWTGDNSPHSTITYENDDGTKTTKYYRYKAGLYAIVGTEGSTSTQYLKGVSSYSGQIYYNSTGTYAYQDLSYTSSSYFRTYYSCCYDDTLDHTSYNISSWDYVSSKLPIFDTFEHAKAYINNGSLVGLLNGAPESVTPAPVPVKPVTPVSIYINNFKGKNVTVNDITNVNYYIANNWVTTTNKTENLTTVINNYYDNDTGEPDSDKDEEESTPSPRPTLTPTENEPSGDTNTYNFFIEIENILSPIKVTVENIYNFFKIDTEQIGNAWQLDYVPSADFQQLVDAFDKMSNAFGQDVYIATVTQTPIYSENSNTNGETLKNATSQQGQLITDYPVISFKCPDILSPYISTTDSDGNKAIILCNFKDYALYFARFRAFINIVLWIGLLFYLMREVKVNFVIH